MAFSVNYVYNLRHTNALKILQSCTKPLISSSPLPVGVPAMWLPVQGHLPRDVCAAQITWSAVLPSQGICQGNDDRMLIYYATVDIIHTSMASCKYMHLCFNNMCVNWLTMTLVVIFMPRCVNELIVERVMIVMARVKFAQYNSVFCTLQIFCSAKLTHTIVVISMGSPVSAIKPQWVKPLVKTVGISVIKGKNMGYIVCNSWREI